MRIPLSLLAAVLGFGLGLPTLAGNPAARSHPADSWEFTLESGALWQVGDNTPLDYEIVPTQLTLRTPAHLSLWEGAAGDRVLIRGRFSLLLESFLEGPESYYVGIAGAPSIEYWLPSERTSFFFSIGGGAGVTDSTGEKGGQGQDFTLNWFMQLGLRQALTQDLSLLAGSYFIHHSNGGQTSPNPGIDALGFTIGLGWRF